MKIRSRRCHANGSAWVTLLFGKVDGAYSRGDGVAGAIPGNPCSMLEYLFFQAVAHVPAPIDPPEFDRGGPTEAPTTDAPIASCGLKPVFAKMCQGFRLKSFRKAVSVSANSVPLVNARQTFVISGHRDLKGWTFPQNHRSTPSGAGGGTKLPRAGAINENHSFCWCYAGCVDVGWLYFNSRNASSSKCHSLRHSIRRVSFHRPDGATDYAQGCYGNARARLHAL
jgi:hypothetical protein